MSQLVQDRARHRPQRRRRPRRPARRRAVPDLLLGGEMFAIGHPQRQGDHRVRQPDRGADDAGLRPRRDQPARRGGAGDRPAGPLRRPAQRGRHDAPASSSSRCEREDDAPSGHRHDGRRGHRGARDRRRARSSRRRPSAPRSAPTSSTAWARSPASSSSSSTSSGCSRSTKWRRWPARRRRSRAVATPA